MAVGRVSQQITQAFIADSDAAAHVTQMVVQAFIPVITRSPTTPTGAGVTQEFVQAFIAGDTSARVTQMIVQAFVIDTSALGEPGTGPTIITSFGSAT